MSEAEREALYDAEIAPALLVLAEKCRAAGMPFLAVVEWSPESWGRTLIPGEKPSISFNMVYWAQKAHGNADALIGAMVKHAREHGHSSAYLHMLGVMTEPEEKR